MDDILPSVIREAGRAVADRLLAPRRANPYDDYRDRRRSRERARSRSPTRSYSSSGTSRANSPGYDRRESSGNYRVSNDRDYRRYTDSPQRGRTPPRNWSPERHGPHYRHPPSPPRPHPARRAHARHGPRGGHTKPQQRDAPQAPHGWDSRPAGWTRTRFPPDATLAPRDPSGHPIFPATEAGEDDDDLGALAGLVEPTNYAARETDRRTKAVSDTRRQHGTRRPLDALTIALAGVWATAGPVETFSQAVNLMRWIYRGDNYATEFMRAILTRVAADPTAPRTIGEVAVLQNQNQAMAHFNAAVFGARPPDRANRAHPIIVDKPAAALAAPVAAPIATVIVIDEDDPMVAATTATPTAASGDTPALAAAAVAITIPDTVAIEDEDDDDTSTNEVAVFLGAARRVLPDNTVVHLGEHAATSEGMSRHGTTASIARAVRWYKNMPTSHWPHGMRVSETSWPTTTTAEPLWLDVGAWFTLNALLPRRDLFSSLHRASSLKVAVRLLSVDGMFDYYADTGNYVFNTLPLEHYPFDAGNISFCHVTSWFVQHGIAPRSEALSALQSFARSRRNRTASASNPNETTFAMDWPNSPADVCANMLRADDLWSEMHHGPVRAGITTTYPRHPGAPPVADITMDNGEPFPQLPPVSPGEEIELRDGLTA